MTMTDPILQMLAYELAGIFAALSIWLILRANKKHKQLQTDAAKAVKKLKRLKDQRVESLTSLLADKYGLTGDALAQTANELQDHEQQIYKELLNIFVDQNVKALNAIPNQLEQALNAGLNLLPVGSDARVEKSDQMATDLTKELQDQIDELAKYYSFIISSLCDAFILCILIIPCPSFFRSFLLHLV